MQKRMVITIPRTNKENQNYIDKIKSAISYVDEAINHISYMSLIDQDTGENINKSLINKLQDIIYELKDCEEQYVYKPYDGKR